MKDMVRMFKEELSRGVIGSNKDVQEEVELYSSVETVLSKDFDRVDLESVFSVIDGVAGGSRPVELGYLPTFLARRGHHDKFLDPPSEGERNTARRLLGKFQDFVKRVCWVKPEKTDQIMTTYVPFFSTIFNALGGSANSFNYKGTWYNVSTDWQMFTTNYDNVIEVFWRDGVAQFPLNTGFSYDTRSQTQVMNPQQFLQPHGLKLVKLHGSVTWWMEEGTWVIVEKDQPPSPAYLHRKYGEQVMLYPIQQKETFVPPYLDMFYGLNDALRQHAK